jgi:hypothetical protein
MQRENEFPVYPPLLFVRITEKLRYFFLRLNRRFTHPNVVLWEMVHNLWLAAGIGVVAELGIADLLKEGPRTVDELAELTGTDKRSLYRVMRMLATQGIFKEIRGKRFISTPLAKPLREDQIRDLLLLHMTPRHFQMFGEMITSVRTGKNVSGRMGGSALFDHIGNDESRNQRFNKAMTSATRMQASAILSAFPFKGCRKIIDVGGGQGLLLAAILHRNSQAEGVVFDLPKAVAHAGEVISSYSLGERMRAEEGDFFKKVPGGGDIYIMKSILHDWDDDASLKILGNVRDAMGEGSRLLVIDSVLDEGNSPSFGKMTDILMMVSAGGKERTRAEWETLLGRAGLRIRKIRATVSPHSIIEADRAT